MRKVLGLCAVLVSFAVPASAQRISCESIGNSYRECRIGASGTIRMVMEMSQNACQEGVTWGTRSDGLVWVDRGCRAIFSVRTSFGSSVSGKTRLVCESQNQTRSECPADTSKGVALARQLSRTACVEGVSWGSDNDRERVWVDDGCRAEFVLGRWTEPLQPVEVLDSTILCEPKDGRRTECAANTAAGVQLVRQLSTASCKFGSQWGYDEKGIWVTKGCKAEFAVRNPRPAVQALDCQSQNAARTHCPAETRFGVALVRQLGQIDCVLEETWGFDAEGVWVSEGCHAQFVLGGFRLAPSAVPSTAAKVLCESVDGGRKQCAVNASRGAGLVRQISDSECVLNRTWGYDRDGIWVADGCRAEFAVAK